MYAKSLIPGDGVPDVPMLIVTAPPGAVIVDQLHHRGWSPYGGELLPDPAGDLEIMLDRLALVIEGDVLLEDNSNPLAPPGWWEAVDVLGGRVVCVVIRDGAMNFRDPNAGAQLEALVDTPGAAQALLTVRHV